MILQASELRLTHCYLGLHTLNVLEMLSIFLGCSVCLFCLLPLFISLSIVHTSPLSHSASVTMTCVFSWTSVILLYKLATQDIVFSSWQWPFLFLLFVFSKGLVAFNELRIDAMLQLVLPCTFHSLLSC